MPYLFDTDMLSAVLRRTPDLAVLRRVATVPPDEQYMSAVSLGELLYGARRIHRADLEEAIVLLARRVAIIPFDAVVADTFATLRVGLERAGTPVAEPDLRIAATAVSSALTLVTGNVRHFAHIPGLAMENWLTARS
ncbi:MAG: type II toxin-antitoxin system VapC family toxin [Chloroflexota bacterium]|nr:MAG: type II toxin-antitoxin system VapC family toxin [Chloroflexota bacterium]